MSVQSGTFPPKAASRDRSRWRQRHELLRTGEHLLTYGLLIIVAIFVLLPLMWAFAASFTPNAKVFEYAFPFSLRALFPVDFTLEAYEALFARGFGNALKNSFWLSGVTVVLGGSINALADFAFARFEFRGKRTLFLTVILLPFLVPVDLTAIPRFILVNSLDWRNTWQALIVPAWATAWRSSSSASSSRKFRRTSSTPRAWMVPRGGACSSTLSCRCRGRC